MYADWLDERGRNTEAFCWRWMARKGKRPSPVVGSWKGTFNRSGKEWFFSLTLNEDGTFAWVGTQTIEGRYSYADVCEAPALMLAELRALLRTRPA